MGLSEDKDIVVLCGGHTLTRSMYPKVPMVRMAYSLSLKN